MTSVSDIELNETYEQDAPSATQRIQTAKLDADHREIVRWLNEELLPALDNVIRDDDTLTDGLVRSRNLHAEVVALIASKAGWQPKADVITASTGSNITLSAPGASIGGKAMSSGQRFLAKDQTAPAENGIYVWNGAAVAATRATDADTATELGYAYVTVSVAGAATLAGTSWVCNQAAADITILGSTAITFGQVGGTMASAAMQPVVSAVTLALARAAMGPWGDAVATVTGGTTSRSMADRFATIAYPRDFGAAADGATNDTAAINAAISSGASIIDGEGKTYLVTTVLLASNKTLRNIVLKEQANAGVSALTPVVKIGDDAVAITRVSLENVRIDGNRQNLANINLAAGEDGGMHGIRVGGLATDIRIINCEANYCGTAGLAVHNQAAGATATYPIKRVYVENFVAEWNREHGMFADSVDGLFVRGAVLNNNGQTLTGSLPDTDGRTGAKVGGVLFGAGFDLETYVGYASSYIKNVQFVGVVCKGNAQASLLYIPSVVSAVAEVPCQNIHLRDCDFDKSTLGVNLYGLKLFADSAVGSKYGIDGVVISGRLNGHLDVNNTKGVTFQDGWIEADASVAYKALMNNSDAWNATVPGNKNNVLVQTFAALGVVKDTGAGTWAPTVSQTVLADGVHQLQIDANITGGTIAGGNMSWTLTMPTGVEIVSATVCAFNTTSAKTTPAHVAMLTSTTLRVFVTPTDDTVSIQLRVQVMI